MGGKWELSVILIDFVIKQMKRKAKNATHLYILIH